MNTITIKNIKKAYQRIEKHIILTPIVESDEINKILNARIVFKLECNQITGSFKIRGALNKILQLSEVEKSRGIVAYSSGNHGQAVAYAAKIANIDAVIVMPSDAPNIKIENTNKHGAKVILYDRKNENREQIAEKIAKDSKRILIKPFDDKDIIIGQGTAGLEIEKQLKSKKIFPDIFLCCCSGGGLIAGTSTYLKKYYKNMQVYSVEPKYFDDTKISLEKGIITPIDLLNHTICDALTVNVPGKITFNINKMLIKEGLVVNDDEVKNAIRTLYHKLKIVVEPGGAAPTAALLSKKNNFNNKVVLVMVSGGNIDKKFFHKIINYEKNN